MADACSPIRPGICTCTCTCMHHVSMLSSPSSCTNIQCPGMKKGPATLAHADRQMYTHMNYAAVTRTKQANPLVSKLFHWTLLHREKKAAREYAIIFHSQTSSLAQLNHTDQWKFKPVTDLNTHTSRHQHMHTFKVTINITVLAVCCKLRVASDFFSLSAGERKEPGHESLEHFASPKVPENTLHTCS